jgi:predicted DNA-binding protein
MAKEKKNRPGLRALYVEVPVELGERLDTLAERNHRTIKGEVLIALEKHLAEEEEQHPARSRRRKTRPE